MKIFKFFKLYSLLLLAVLANNIFAQTTDPILRIETGTHTAKINRIASDTGNRYLVTASDDKTVKVWDLQTGALLRTLRPPIGEGAEGKIYAVALSPDGSTIACGGWTGYEWDNTHSIYLFDRRSGEMLRRIAGLPNVIFHLAFSPDGGYLAATLGAGNGLRVYRMSDFTLVKEDKDYGKRSLWADFDGQGRLVTACFDGYIRLYDRNFKRIAKAKAPGGEEPFSAVFSPDGGKIAVGFNDSRVVDVLSSADLHLLYTPDNQGVNNGDISNVAWSRDGRFLFAGGRWYVSGKNTIRKWSDGGRGGYKDLPAAEQTIMHILPLKEGGIAFGSADPAWGVFDANDNLKLIKTPAIADYRGCLEKFLLSFKADRAQFGFKSGGESPARFDIRKRILQLNPSPDNSLKAPSTQSNAIKVIDWKNEYSPKLNGSPLALEQYETSRCLAIASDERNFALGTDWYLRYYDSKGNLLWQKSSPAATWSVNISGDDKVAVSAYADGTIRWYRAKDGEELLAFFPHNDKTRWVLWTPQGYYDASPGGEDLIGWHLNRGKDSSADFFPASRFRSTYYRPDVIDKVLETLNVEKALELADAEANRKAAQASITKSLPPVITIVSPYDGATVTATEITLKYKIRSPSGEPVTGIKALINGRPVSTSRGMKAVSGDYTEEIKITIPERDCEVSLIAENRFSASVPAIVRLKWGGAKMEFTFKPQLYVLAVGVGDYNDTQLTLDYADNDARDFANLVKLQEGGLYEKVIVKSLVNAEATKDNVLDGLEWLQKQTTSKDVALIFFAGHGVTEGGQYYLLPVNADWEAMKRTALTKADFLSTVEAVPGKVVVFLDACHSGKLSARGGKTRSLDINSIVNELSSAENGAVVFSSCVSRQESMEDAKWSNGAFTEALLEGIKGKADAQNKGVITVKMLDYYVCERVKVLTQGKQAPCSENPLADFPLFIVK